MITVPNVYQKYQCRGQNTQTNKNQLPIYEEPKLVVQSKNSTQLAQTYIDLGFAFENEG